MSLTIASAIGYLSTTTKAARAIGGIAKWLSLNTEKPLGRALKATADRYENTFPDIKRQLRALLDAHDAPTRLEDSASRSAADLDAITDLFVEASDFFIEPPEETQPQAREIILSFINYLNEELLKEPNPSNYLDKKDIARAQHIHDAMRDTKDELATTIRREKFESRIAGTRKFTKNLNPSDSRAIWLKLEDEAENETDLAPTHRAQVHLKLAALALHLNDYQEASARLKEASTAHPEAPTARFNKAFALALSGDLDEASEIVELALKHSKHDQYALTIKAQILIFQDKFDEVISLLRPAVETETASPDCLRLFSDAATMTNLFSEAIKATDILKELEPDAPNGYFLSGNAHAMQAEHHIKTSGLSEAALNSIQHARTDYERSAKLAEKGGLSADESRALAALAKINLFNDDHTAALGHARRACLLDPTAPPPRTILAMAASASGGFNEAIDALEGIPKTASNWTAENLLLYAQAAAKLDPSSSAARLDQIIRQIWNTPTEAPTYARLIVVESAIAAGRTDFASIELASMDDRDVEVRLQKAYLAAAIGNTELAIKTTESVLNELGDHVDRKVLGTIADLNLKLGRNRDAAELYMRLGASPNGPRFVFERFIRAVLQLDGNHFDEQLLEMAALESNPSKRHPHFHRALIRTYQRRGDVRSEEIQWRALAMMEPTSSIIRLGLARCLFRQGRMDECSNEITLTDLPGELSPDDLFICAELLRRLARTYDSMLVAFLAWKADTRSPATSGRYISHFTAFTDDQTLFLNRDSTSDPSFVELELEGGETISACLSYEEWLPTIDTIPPSSPVGRRLLDSSVGDTIKWSDTLAEPVLAKLKSIKHPFVHAFHASIQRSISGTPGGTSRFARINLSPDLSEMKAILEHNANQQDELLELLRKQTTPLFVASRLLRRERFETWHSLTSPGGLGVTCNFSTTDEKLRESRALSRSRVICDYTALLTLAKAQWLDMLTRTFEVIIVPQFVHDALSDSLSSINQYRGRGIHLIGTSEGQLFRSETSPEEVELLVAILEDATSFAAGRTVGLPRNLTEPEEDKYSSVFGIDGIAAMVTAGAGASGSAALMTDQAVLATVAHDMYGVDSVSVSSWLAKAVEDGLISYKQYVDGWTQLAQSGYRALSVSSRMLDTIVLEQMGLHMYNQVLDRVLKPEISGPSAMSVFAAHILEMIRSVVVWEYASSYMDTLCLRLTSFYSAKSIIHLWGLVSSSSPISTLNRVQIEQTLRAHLAAQELI